MNGSNANKTNTTSNNTILLLHPTQLNINLWFITSITTATCSMLLLCLLLTASCMDKRIRHGSGVLIVHLMLIQLFICGFHFPISYVEGYLSLTHRNLSLHCPSLLTARFGSMFAENWASVLLAINRYVAITMPHSYYRSWVKKRTLAVMIVLPWLISLSITFPVYFGVGADMTLQAPRLGPTYCVATANAGFYGTVWVSIGVYVPMLLMGLVYITLFYRLVGGQHFSCNTRISNNVTAVMRRRRERHICLAKILVVSFVWYSVCYIPAPLTMLALPQLYLKSIMLRHWLRMLVGCGYGASPFIFLVLSLDYQRAVGRLLKFSCPIRITLMSEIQVSVNRSNSYARRGPPLPAGNKFI